MSERVYVNRSGGKIWSPNSKEQLCEVIEELRAEVEILRSQRDSVTEMLRSVLGAESTEERQA